MAGFVRVWESCQPVAAVAAAGAVAVTAAVVNGSGTPNVTVFNTGRGGRLWLRCDDQSGTSRQAAASSSPSSSSSSSSSASASSSALSHRSAAFHKLLLDFAAVPDAREASRALPALLEGFWKELVDDTVGTGIKEYLLHRLAEEYGHGTLTMELAASVVAELQQLGIKSILDPLAHTGFHAKLLETAGLTVEAADLDPPPPERCWREVKRRPMAETPWSCYSREWALFLSWLPHWSEIGVEALQHFEGDVVVVLGDSSPEILQDGSPGWTGTAKFREALAADWTLLLCRRVQASPWPRVHETLCIYTRKPVAATRAEAA